ncbi:type II toxin-antitoxin system HicB family antitoxin [Intrasporangium calvum]|uniref:type II toxin-antitoxin system HicB family antitoxin n=1 Tax=Intrasporangium calvum TaxID=53358 RepID=UPI000DF637B8|nr:hypothetical protein [Intrasporangium calvum]AXG14517.1 hypothetical protein DN585_14850 [Intrasporangium calvum]
MATTVRIQYEELDGNWVATSPDLPGYRAVGDRLPDVRSMVFEGVPFFVNEDDVDIREELPETTTPVVVVEEVHVSYGGVTVWGASTRVRAAGGGATLHEGYRDSELTPSQGQPLPDTKDVRA